jgi:trk system potassium uptake protein TrkA
VWISPEQLVTEYIERLIRNPGALQVLDFADGRVRLVGLRARKGGLLVGQQLRTLREHIPNAEARVAAIYRAGRSIEPGGRYRDRGRRRGVLRRRARRHARMMNELRRRREPGAPVVIAGGGNIGFRLAKQLEKHNQVKLIERDPKRARRVSELLEGTIVLNGDAADEELLIEENIDSCDVFAALTNSEEANILSAMLAKRLGATKVMALINKPSYAELMESGRIDIAISPQTITIGSLLAHVRRGDVVRVHSLRRGAAEALEAMVHGDAPQLARGRPARRGYRCRRAPHRLHRARRRRDHGAPRHGRPGGRSRDPVHHRPAPRRAGRAPVPRRDRASAGVESTESAAHGSCPSLLVPRSRPDDGVLRPPRI